MNSRLTDQQRNQLEVLAEEYASRKRSGEAVSIEDYISKHPLLADDIQELFPVVSMLDKVGHKIQHRRQGLGTDELTTIGPGTRLGEYELIRQIGRGGMGVVFQARHVVLESNVAIKVLPSTVSRPKLRERFLREAAAAARMDHPNIVRVFDFGEHGESLYYVMSLVEGWGLNNIVDTAPKQMNGTNGRTSPYELTLDEQNAPLTAGAATPTRIQSNESNGQHAKHVQDETEFATADSMTTSADSEVERSSFLTSSSKHDSLWRWVAKIGKQASDALDYAHSMGVIHRDIKPANLMIDADETIFVLDFGLAKVIDDQDLTATGDVMGTLRYMPPEAFAGRTDHRSDIYSLGLTLYELLANRAAFEGTDRGQLVGVITEGNIPRLGKLIPKIPSDLETVIQKSIAADPVDRYQSAADFRDDLIRYLNGEPVNARRASLFYKAVKWSGRNPVIASMAGIVTVLLVGLAISFLVANAIRGQRDVAVESQNRAEVAETSALENLGRAERAEREVRWRNHMVQAGLIRRNGGLGQRTNSIAEIDKALELIEQHTPESRRELSNELIADLALTDITFEESLPATLSAKIDVSPDFELAAIWDQKGHVVLRRFNDGSVVRKLEFDLTQVVQIRFSPDGKYLCASGDRSGAKGLVVWNVSNGTLLCSSKSDTYHSFDFVPNTTQMLTARSGKWVLLDYLTGKVVNSAKVETTAGFVLVSSDGKAFANYGNTSGPVDFFQLPGFEKVSAWTPPTGKEYYAMDWHPNRSEVAIGVDDGSVHVTRPDQPKSLRRLPGGHGRGTQVEFSPDGSQMLSNDWSGRFRLWDYESGRILLEENMNADPLRFGPRGQRLGVIRDDGRARFGKIIQSEIFRPLARDTGTVETTPTAAAFHPSGDWLALCAPQGIELFDMHEFREVTSLPTKLVRSIQFHDEQLWTRSPFSGVERRQVDRNENTWSIQLPKRFAGQGLHHTDQMAIKSEYVVFANSNGALLFPNSAPDQQVALKPHYDCRFVAISPDEKWIATGSHWGLDVKIWKPDGEMVTTLPISASSKIAFSPDGKWLTTSGGGTRIWEVGSWDEIVHLGGQMRTRIGCFSPNSRLLVYEKQGASHLYDVESGNDVGELVDPYSIGINSHVFSPDGGQLLVVDSCSVWNIRQIRKELSQRGIDWLIPNMPPLVQAESPDSPVQINLAQPKPKPKPKLTPEQVALANFQRREKLLQQNPDDAYGQNDFAWELITTPIKKLRDPKRALELSLQSVKLDPDNDANVNTLGVIYHRVGEYQKSLDILLKNLNRSSNDGLAFDLYFIAMSFSMLEQDSQAESYLLMANRWTDQMLAHGNLPGNYIEELKQIRVEAETLIRKDKSVTDE